MIPVIHGTVLLAQLSVSGDRVFQVVKHVLYINSYCIIAAMVLPQLSCWLNTATSVAVERQREPDTRMCIRMCCGAEPCQQPHIKLEMHGGAGSDLKKEAEEAEYAWLSLDSLKPFREGDGETVEGEDPLLKGSIAAAEQAVATAADIALDEDQAANSGAESMSDSDGGGRHHDTLLSCYHPHLAVVKSTLHSCALSACGNTSLPCQMLFQIHGASRLMAQAPCDQTSCHVQAGATHR